jgi:hypothetical protein
VQRADRMARIGVADARYMGLRWPRDAGGKTVNRLLDWLGGAAVRWRWVVIVGWLIILGGLLGARHEFGGPTSTTTRCQEPAQRTA